MSRILFSGGINPGTAEWLKLYLKAIVNHTTQEKIDQSNVESVTFVFKSEAQDFF